MLLAYDQDGTVFATLDYLVQYDAAGAPLGLVDFAAHEEAGGEHTDIWNVGEDHPDKGGQRAAKGSKVWPEYLGAEALRYRVELDGPPGRKRIAALVHTTSGHRRERAAIDDEIARRIAEKQAEAIARAVEIRASLPRRLRGRKSVVAQSVSVDPEPADLRDLVGGPDRPLRIDADGRTAPTIEATRPVLPLVARR
jgi:hypothetical protein